MLYGLSTINIELTSRCNKECWCCGRRKIDKEHPNLKQTYGDIDYELLKTIAKQVPSGVTVQLHNNGEPTLYAKLGDAINLFSHTLTSFNTNGKLLLEKADEIINNLDVLVVSVIENDVETDTQFNILRKFIELKGLKKPLVNIRCLGHVDYTRYIGLGQIITRILHNPLGNYDYRRRPTLPEIGICLDLLHHLAIDRFGNISVCVRFDLEGDGVIGHCYIDDFEALTRAWNSEKRKKFITLHKSGQRSMIRPCHKCEYWGVPTGEH